MNPFQSALKQKQKTYTNDSILEALRNMGGSVGGSLTHDVAEKGVSDAWQSLLGQMPQSGDVREQQAISFDTPEKQPPQPFRHVEAPRQTGAEMDAMQVRQELAAVRQELKALSESIKNLHSEIEKAVEDIPVNPGVYHVNFLQNLRSMLMLLKEQIDDSASWLNVTAGRKQKKQYWGLYKKHGTKFGLSSERTMATQSG